MSVINTNTKSLITQNALNINSRALSAAMEQLSTGKRINGAKDDAAGLAISDRMTSQIRGLEQAVRNANDGISLIQTAEGATKEITNMLQRMRELAVQAANDTNTGDDRDALQNEVEQLTQEITRIAKNTQWNGMLIFNNASQASTVGTTADPGVANLQVGANSSDDPITIAFKGMDAKDLGLGSLAGTAPNITITTTIKVTSLSDANTAIDTLDAALKTVDGERATYGAKINRLTYAIDNLTNITQNTSESRSRILDTDYAKATSELSRTQIIQQAATAILAQANQDPQSVMKLLQG